MPKNKSVDRMAEQLILEVQLFLEHVANDPRYFVSRDTASRIVRNSRRVP